MSEKTRVYFVALSDSSDPNVVSAIVGRQPSIFHPVGEPLTQQPGAASRKRSVWTIESALPRSSPFEAQLESLLDHLERLPGITVAVNQFDAGLACYAWRETPNPG